MATQEIKRTVGRPRKQEPVVTFNFRLEKDLYDWVISHKGGKSINQYVNDIIRKEAGL